jgi:TRAP-type C4-dicarboxylate transport system permease small subunit
MKDPLPAGSLADRLCGFAFRVSLIMFSLIVGVGGTRYVLFLARGKTTALAWDAKTLFAASAVPLAISLLLALAATWKVRRAFWLVLVQLPLCIVAWKLFYL